MIANGEPRNNAYSDVNAVATAALAVWLRVEGGIDVKNLNADDPTSETEPNHRVSSANADAGSRSHTAH